MSVYSVVNGAPAAKQAGQDVTEITNKSDLNGVPRGAHLRLVSGGKNVEGIYGGINFHRFSASFYIPLSLIPSHDSNPAVYNAFYASSDLSAPLRFYRSIEDSPETSEAAREFLSGLMNDPACLRPRTQDDVYDRDPFTDPARVYGVVLLDQDVPAQVDLVSQASFRVYESRKVVLFDADGSIGEEVTAFFPPGGLSARFPCIEHSVGSSGHKVRINSFVLTGDGTPVMAHASETDRYLAKCYHVSCPEPTRQTITRL